MDTRAAPPPCLECQTGSGRCHSSQIPEISDNQIKFLNASNIDQRNDSQQETISYLNPVVVCIRNNDLLLKAKAEAMGGVELAFAGT